jgi:UDP-N-acetyl-D-glucosamine dehydrogenase
MAGISPIGDVSNQEISEAINSNLYKVSNNFDSIATSEIVIICVPTPLDNDRKPDNSFLVSATSSIASKMQSGTLIINESTVSPGTTRGLIKETLDTSGVP